MSLTWAWFSICCTGIILKIYDQKRVPCQVAWHHPSKQTVLCQAYSQQARLPSFDFYHEKLRNAFLGIGSRRYGRWHSLDIPLESLPNLCTAGFRTFANSPPRNSFESRLVNTKTRLQLAQFDYMDFSKCGESAPPYLTTPTRSLIISLHTPTHFILKAV